jgi:hypothetical protein
MLIRMVKDGNGSTRAKDIPKDGGYGVSLGHIVKLISNSKVAVIIQTGKN